MLILFLQENKNRFQIINNWMYHGGKDTDMKVLTEGQ
jgi:hypothetical protein